MGIEWYVEAPEGTVGPLTAAQLREAAARGDVTPGTRVRNSDMSKWVRAENVKGLFALGLAIAPAKGDDDEPSPGMGRPLLITLIAATCLGLLVAGAVIVSHNRSREQARVERANSDLKEAITRADRWAESGTVKGAADPEQDLVAALANEGMHDKAAGDASLSRVKGRKAEIAADRLLEEARLFLDQGQIPLAAEKLYAYLADAHATKKVEAQGLLNDIEAATSPDAASDLLAALPEPEYLQFKQTLRLPGGKALPPALAKRQTATLAAAVPLAEQKRDSIRQKDDAERLAEFERLTAIDEAKAEEARRLPLAVFLGGTLVGKEAADWRLPMKFYEAVKEERKSEFDQPDKWETKFNLDYIPLADGVELMLSVKNIDTFFGSEWTWMIFAACPAGGRPEACSVAFSIDGTIETWSLDVLLDKPSSIHAYTYQSAAVMRAFSPVMRRIAAAKTVRYKLTIGSRSAEATLPADAHEAIRKLVESAKYEDRYILIYGEYPK